MKDRNPVWIIVLTLFINIAGWFGTYYFVTRHQAELDKKQIEKIEKDTVRLDDKSDTILERLSIDEKKKVINVLDRETIKNIQPASWGNIIKRE
jgi:hypothetical protein